MPAAPAIVAFDGLESAPVRAEELSWASAKGVRASTEAAKEPLLHAMILVADTQGRRLRSLSIRFDRRVDFDGVVGLTGRDPSGSLRVTLQLGPVSGTVDIRLAFRQADGASPAELLPALLCWSALQEGRQLSLLGASDVQLVGPAVIGHAAPVVPPGYERAVRALARIEDKTGSGFVMPAVMTEGQARDLAVTDRLLQGVALTGHWSGLAIDTGDLGPEFVDQLRTARHGVMLEMEAEHRLELATATLVVGTVQYRYRHVRVDERHGPGLFLIPGVDDSFEVKLIRVAERTRDDGATSWVPQAMTDPYAGSWVAQSGTKIVTSGPSFESVAHAVRASGRLATVWRVPAAGELQPVIGAIA